MAEAAVEFPSVPNYFCHRCARSVKINPTTVLTCPHCESEFIEELTQELEENDRARNNSRLTASPMDVATLLSNIFASVTPDEDYPFPRSRNTNNSSNNNRTAADDADDEEDKDDEDEEEDEEEQEEVEEMGERINRRLWVGPYRLPRPVRRRNQESRPPPRFLGNMLLGRYPNFSDLFALSSQEFRSNPRDYAWGSDGLDNIITQLLNQMENSGPAPAKKEDIDNLPDVLVSATQIDLFAQCSVCMDYFIVEERVKELPCHHFYHEDCIVPWLKMHGTCPICRYSISPDESPKKTETSSNNSTSNNENSMDNTRNSPRPSRARLLRYPQSSSSSSSWSPIFTALRLRPPADHQHFSASPTYSPPGNNGNNNIISSNNNITSNNNIIRAATIQ
ncbi:hypothetical protein HELRODRAFT_188105 [Helobdella robusta]|uniref:RING-type E3 ubiquitin transferase n=1 Tax=Helobdella robusta TaxID=6412 RepID=T1FPN1_HELRO|nr:hypothetical protein HELRODRAFT_188105 [Helobdella robusta]ESO13103.1 hypothetical protein HELRODRAFT_188105 [Helobdella robusta]